MVPIHDTAAWERPFLTVQNAMDHVVNWTGHRAGTTQLALYPVVLALSLLHIPFALTHLLIRAVAERDDPGELPILTREELRKWTRSTEANWISRHAALRECNPAEVADGIALPVIDALREAARALEEGSTDCDELGRVAAQLLDLPTTNAPDARAIGLCIQRHAAPTANTGTRQTV